MKKRRVQLLYDRECPACDFYCQRVEIDDANGELQRIDAREPSDIMQEVTDIGLDIDEGMVLKVDDQLHYGSDAIHQLALLSTQKGAVNKLGYWAFRSPTLARVLYPMLAACRNLLLKMLGKTRINNLDIEDNDRF